MDVSNGSNVIVGGMDAGDLQRRQPLAMPLFTTVIFAPFVFENDDFFSTFLRHNAGFDACLCYHWRTNRYCSPLANHQDGGEHYGVANLASELFNIDAIPRTDTILPSPGFHNGIHTLSFMLYDKVPPRCDAFAI